MVRGIEKIPEAKVRFQDESLTSVVAEDRLKSRKKPYEKGDIDKMDSSVLLPIADALLTTPAYLMGWSDDLSDYTGRLYYCIEHICNFY